MNTILLIVLVLLLIGAIPAGRRWGYAGGGVFGFLLLLVLIGLLLGYR